MNTIALRKAALEDMELLFKWRNDPWIVALGSTSSTVSWEEHKSWFKNTLSSAERQLYFITQDHLPLGQVRFDRENENWCEVSIYLMKEYTGKGLGVLALKKGCETILKQWSQLTAVVAYIKDDNQASISAFKKAGFQQPVPSHEPNRSGHITLCFYQHIPHNRLTFGEEEVEAVSQVVASGQWAHGEKVRQLEQALTAYVDCRYAIAVSSGLSAIRLTLKALNIEAGDEVLVPAYSCVALANAILALGAKPIPVDIRTEDWNMDPQHVSALITSKTRAILIVNTFGAPAPLEELKALGLPIIEDCSHGFGFPLKSPMGNRSDIAILSFYATKLMGAGEGGAILTNNEDLAQTIDGWRFYQDKPPNATRLNDKMTNIEASLALCQLKRLNSMINRRQEVAANYAQQLQPLVQKNLIKLPPLSSDRVWYRYVIEVSRKLTHPLIEQLEHYHIHTDFPVDNWRSKDDTSCPVANQAYARLISLPIYPTLSENEQQRICLTINKLVLELSSHE